MTEITEGLCRLVREYVREFRDENQNLYNRKDYARARRMYLRYRMEGANPNGFHKFESPLAKRQSF